MSTPLDRVAQVWRGKAWEGLCKLVTSSVSNISSLGKLWDMTGQMGGRSVVAGSVATKPSRGEWTLPERAHLVRDDGCDLAHQSKQRTHRREDLLVLARIGGHAARRGGFVIVEVLGLIGGGRKDLRQHLERRFDLQPQQHALQN